jgi:mRNA interferase MazF
MSTRQPSRGDIWSVSFDPTLGREQSGTRPALVLSVDKFNHGPADLVVVLPVTSKDKRQPIHVPVAPPEGGLKLTSFIKCEDIRTVSRQRFRQFHGIVSARTMAEIEMRVRVLLNL